MAHEKQKEQPATKTVKLRIDFDADGTMGVSLFENGTWVKDDDPNSLFSETSSGNHRRNIPTGTYLEAAGVEKYITLVGFNFKDSEPSGDVAVLHPKRGPDDLIGRWERIGR